MSASLKPWYAIATPHEDIRNGRLAEVVFAANIWAAVRDIAPEVHLDPEEFFRKTCRGKSGRFYFLRSGFRNKGKNRTVPLTASRNYQAVEMGTVKDEVRKWLDQIPDDASFEDIFYHIYVRQRVERGLKDVEKGRALSQDEIEKRMAKWPGRQSGPNWPGTI